MIKSDSSSKKLLNSILLPIFIFLLILAIIILSLFSLLYNFSIDTNSNTNIFDTNVKFNNEPAFICNREFHIPGTRNIIFRIDDIQAFYLNDLQIQMIDDALSSGVSPSLSVIPLGISDDKKIYDYLRLNHCKVEIILHGYDNKETYEFGFLTYRQADNKLKKGLNELNKIEPDIKTFVPPGNEISKDAAKAVYDNDFKVISAKSENSEYGYTTSTYDWDNYKFNDINEVIRSCNNTLNSGKKCIIMVHPQDYLTNGVFDSVKYRQYINLLIEIKKLDAKVINFRDTFVA